MKKTYHTPNTVPIKRIPPNTQRHTPNPPFSPSLYPLPTIINVHPRPAIINTALDVLVAADAQAGEGDVGGRDAEVGAAAAETFDDGAGEADWERGKGRGGAGEGGAGVCGAHFEGFQNSIGRIGEVDGFEIWWRGGGEGSI